MKKCLLLLWFCILTVCLFAQNGIWNNIQNNSSERSTHVTAAQALEVGYTFMRTGSHERGNASANGNVSKQTMQLVYTGTVTDGTECYYVFSLQPRGFVIVAADERAEPILGYSYDNSFMVEGMPENVRYWLDQYGKQIKAAVDNGDLPSTEIAERWTLLKSGQAMPNRSVTAVSPLIQTTWNQDYYYNQLCPADATGPNGHAYAGCVATAMAQIIRYWQWPNQGFNSHSYDHSSYGTLSVDYNAATYNYNNMPNSLSSSSSSTQKNEVAKLIYHCGVAVDMNYGPNGSSAYFYPVVSGLYNYFAFANNGTYVLKSDYSDNDWANLIKQELNNARPVFYSGQGSGGHAFVCDGYDNNGTFHFNWGWGGYNDGNFALNALTPGSYSFSEDQEAIIGISATGSFLRCSTSQMVFNASVGGESDVQTLSVRGHSLNGSINVSVGNGFKVSTNGSSFSTSVTLPSSGGSLYLKYVPTTSNNTEYTMTLTSGTSSASVTLYGSVSAETCIAPKNLTGTHNGTAVNLSWNEPVTYSSGSPASAILSWETGSDIMTYWGYGAVSHCMVHRFEPSDLTPYNQYLLKTVSFIGSPYATSYSIVVYKGGSYSNGYFNSGEQVVNQIVPMSTVNTTGWNTITLANPVLVDATSELWFGVVATGDYVIPYVEGDVVSNKGNVLGLMFDGNNDFYWYNGYEVNIPLKGTLEKISSQVLRYDVYRQSTLIGNTTNTAYTDNSPLNSSCAYTVSAVWSSGCSEDATVTVSAPAATLPTITTNSVSSVTTTTAVCGGNVTNGGNRPVTARGVCWSTSPNPTVSNSHTTDGTGTGAFMSSITGLTLNTTYYVRAYATNSVGTNYGEEVSFTTLSTDCAGVIVSDTMFIQLCESEFYYWNGMTITETGIYMDTLQSALGCDSVEVLLVTVVPTPIVQTRDATTCKCDLFGQNSLEELVTLDDIANADIVGMRVEWSTSPTGPWFESTPVPSTSIGVHHYYVRQTNIYQTIECTGPVAELTVVIREIPAPQIIGGPYDFCNESEVLTQTLTAIRDFDDCSTTSHWFLGNDLVFIGDSYPVNLADIRPVTNVDKTVTYQVKAYNAESGCYSENSGIVTINFHQTPEIQIIYADNICPRSESVDFIMQINSTQTEFPYTVLQTSDFDADRIDVLNSQYSWLSSSYSRPYTNIMDFECGNMYHLLYTVTDANGCFAGNIATFMAYDSEGPIVTPATWTTTLNQCNFEGGNVPDIITTLEGFAGLTNIIDNCGIDYFTYEDVISVSPDDPRENVLVRTYTFYDHCYNTATFTQTFIAYDTTSPYLPDYEVIPNHNCGVPYDGIIHLIAAPLGYTYELFNDMNLSEVIEIQIPPLNSEFNTIPIIFGELEGNTTYWLKITTNQGYVTIFEIFVPNAIEEPTFSVYATPNTLCGDLNFNGKLTFTKTNIHYVVTNDNNVVVYEGPATTVTGLEPGLYHILGTDLTTGCQKAVNKIVVNNTQNPVFTVSVQPNHACVDNLFDGVISVNAASTTFFSFNGGAFGLDTIWTSLGPGIYTIVAQDILSGCETSTDVLVATETECIPILTTNNRKFCINEENATLTAEAVLPDGCENNGFTYHWMRDCHAVEYEGSTIPIATDEQMCCIYYVTATNVTTGCSVIDRVKVCIFSPNQITYTVNHYPVMYNTYDDSENESLWIGIVPNGWEHAIWTMNHTTLLPDDDPEYDFFVNVSDSITKYASNPLKWNYNEYVTFNLDVVDSNGCPATGTFNLIIGPQAGETVPNPCTVPLTHPTQTSSAYHGNGYNGANHGLETVDDLGRIESVTDYDGNEYPVVQVGNQCWMRENLKTTHYANGTAIPAGGDAISVNEPYYYDYSNHSLPLETRGYLYNWPAAMVACPTGWHLPSNMEWAQFTDYVGSLSVYQCGGNSNNIAKALASTEGWNSDNGECYPGDQSIHSNNASGFGAVPAGNHYGGGWVTGAGNVAYFWSSTEDGWVSAWYRNLYYNNANVGRGTMGRTEGFSVRCLRDAYGTTVTFPAITTGAISNVAQTSATCSGNVTNNGGAPVTARGVCWSTSHNPTIDDSHTTDGSGTGEFSSSLTELESNTLYYVRAYATNSAGTAYGNEISFTTTSCSDISLPYSEDFESYTASTIAATGIEPNCWELVHEDAAMPGDRRPQLYYNTGFAHSGNYSLKLYNRGIYAMPELSEDVPVNRVKLEMYLRQANTKYQLQAGIWEDNGNFVPVATFDNTTTNVEFVTCDFSSYTGNGRRIAFRNTLGSGSIVAYSTNYLDDITLTLLCETISLPYSEDFESFTASTTAATGIEPECWELVQEDVQTPADKRPQLYYESSFAHSGDYSLKLSYRGVYAMPELSEDVPVSRVKLEMYLRQANTKYRLQVGIWEDNGTFVPVASFDNTTTNVEYVTCDFSNYTGNGRRIAFRNTLDNGSTAYTSTNYLDDISLTLLCEKISLPYTEDFESFTASTTAATGIEPTCWELVREDVQTPADKRPQLYYESSFAHSGNYSLKLSYRGVYAMPELSEDVPVSRVKLEMYLRQANTKYRLQVGIWEDNGTFVPVASFDNTTTNVEYVTCDFSNYTGNGRRIAFRNTLDNGSNAYASTNYLDDITLTLGCEAISLPYSENFESYTASTTAATGIEPECWELVQEDVQTPADKRPQLYYESSFAHSGDYSLKLSYRGVYAMPKLSVDVPVNRVKLEMYLRQANTKYRLQVGIWEDNGTFVPVASFDNTTTNVEYVTCDFSNYTGNGRRIAFRNTLDNGSNAYASTNYLDDISLTLLCEKISLPYTEDFESYTTSTTAATGIEPNCWELVKEDAAMPEDRRPQLYYNSGFANSGDYSLKLYNRGVYAMSELSDEVPVNRVRLEMFLRQANAKYQLQVGIWEGNGTFVPVATFDNTTTDVEFVACDFSNYTGNGRRIAFRNTLGSGSTVAYSTNYLDDITLTVMEPCSIYLPYTETFESYTTETTAATGVEPECWELVRTDAPSMPDNKRPQIYYNSSFAHSGDYTLKMGNRCVYAMPEMSPNTPMNQISLEMYLRQPNAAYRLEVGVWDDATSTFQRVKVFNNSTTGVEHVTCDFSGYNGNGRRIAFRNTLGSGSYDYSYNYLDDITLTRITNKGAEVTGTNAAAPDILSADRDMVDIVLYPNPTKDYVNVQCTMNNEQLEVKGVEVIDVYGKVVRTVVGTNNYSPTQINVSGLAAGMYFVRVTTEEGTVTKAFVKR